MTTTRLLALSLLLLGGPASAQGREPREVVDRLEFGACEQRAEAVAWLLKQGPEAFGDVMRGLESSDADARTITADILLHYAEQMESVERYGSALARRLKDPSAVVRGKIGRLLLKAGPKNAPALVRALASKHPDARRIASTALARIGDPVLPRLLKLLEAKSPRLRAGAVRAVGRMTPPRTDFVPQALPMLSDGSEDVRAAAAAALGRIGLAEERVLRELVRMLADDSLQVYVAARDAIMRSSTAWSLLAGELSRDGAVPDERVLYAMTLLRGGAPEFEKVVLEADAERRAQLLGVCSTWLIAEISPDTAAQLARWLDGKHAPTRRAAARLLADPSFAYPTLALKALQRHRKDPDPPIRAAAVRGLAFHGPRDPQTVAALREASADPTPAICAEAVFGLWHVGEPAPGAATRLRELVTRHESPAAARALGSMAPWSAAALDDLIAASRSDNPGLACAALRALVAFVGCRSGYGLELRPVRLAAAPPEVRAACGRALRWLATHQDIRRSGVGQADGRWDSDGFVAHDAQPAGGRGHPDGDIGLTAFALLAFLGAGHVDTVSPFAENVHEGLLYLVREQRQETGVIGSQKPYSYLIQHGIATVALCEATLLGRDPRYRDVAQRAVSFICAARNPKRGWRYEARGGESDTYHTTWMVTALRLAALADLKVDPEAFAGAANIIDKLSDPNFGQIGYDYPGGACARPVERGALETKAPRPPPFDLMVPAPGIALTAAERRANKERERERQQKLAEWRSANPDNGASNSLASTAQGIWARMMADPRRAAEDSEMGRKGAILCLNLPPVWDPERQTVDLCYWQWGALALAHTAPEKHAAAWMRELRKALLANQRPDGSWDPLGPWGSVGGRLYATSAATLALLAPYRFPRGFLNPPSSHRPAHDYLRTAIEQAKGHKVWRCRVVATEMAESVR